MSYTEIQKEIIQYIVDYHKDRKDKFVPCVEALKIILKGKYLPKEVEAAVDDLVSSGILMPLSIHYYLELTESFKSSCVYNIFKNQ